MKAKIPIRSIVVEHSPPRGQNAAYNWTREECEKPNGLIAENGARPIKLIVGSKDPSEGHQVLVYECPYRPGDGEILISIYDVNYHDTGHNIGLDFPGTALETVVDHPGIRQASSGEPFNALFAEGLWPHPTRSVSVRTPGMRGRERSKPASNFANPRRNDG